MSTITSPTLIAEILTGRMPLSDSFNRASAANTRMGVHHGFQLAYADSALGAIAYWPNRPYNTRYLKLGVSGASAAVIAAVNTNAGAQSESVLLTAILSAPLVIDLDLYTAGAADATTYRVYLQVAYIAPVVNNTTGLVSNIGSNDVSIIIEDEAIDFGSRKGLLLGRFNRQGKFVETIGDQAFNNSDINSDNTEGNLPNSMKNSTQLGAAIKAEVYRSASNLRKNIRIENVDDPAIAETLKSTTMPLAGITNSVAGSVGDLAIWNLPVAWSSITLLNEVINHGIYRDVEKFELFKCRFTNSMQFAFHRTPGHNRMVDWVGTADVDKLSTKSEIEVLEDFGSRQFIFDAKDSVFEGDLTLDLVLDFTGYAHDHPYKIFIRNLTVMGNLVINYGQSYLGMAGGTIGTIEYDNVQVFGADNIIRPWPCIKDALATDVALNAAYNALGFTRVRHFANTAAEINFTGYATTGPLLLKYWRDISGACFSKGVIIPTYLHNRVVGSGGSLAMENPWLKEGADAGIILKNSTLPTSILEHLLVPDPQVDSDTAGTMVRVKLQNCKYQKKAALVNVYGYVNTAEFYLAGDYIYNLASINTDNPQDLRLRRNIAAVVNVAASGALSGSSVSVSGNVVAGNKVISTGSADIGAGAIIRGTTLTQGLTVAQGIQAGKDIRAAIDIRADQNLYAGVNVFAQTGQVSAFSDVVALNGKVQAETEVITQSGDIKTARDFIILTGTGKFRSTHNPVGLNPVFSVLQASKILFKAVGGALSPSVDYKIMTCPFSSVGYFKIFVYSTVDSGFSYHTQDGARAMLRPTPAKFSYMRLSQSISTVSMYYYNVATVEMSGYSCLFVNEAGELFLRLGTGYGGNVTLFLEIDY